MKILIVDDDFTSRKLLLKTLESYGECDLACNGLEAVAAFEAAHLDQNAYQIILLDILMPEMDGHGVLKFIREFELKNNIYKPHATRIAMATTLTDKGTIIESFRDQCDGYITKPYTRDSILTQLQKFNIL